MRLFTGSACALVTPFTKDGALDGEALRALCDWQVQSGTDALVICGTTGEASTLTEQEQREALRIALETVDGRVPVLAGVGGNDTARVCRACRTVAREGADGALAVTPYYNKTTQEGLVAHYTAVAEASDVPVVLYNVPSRTGLNLLPQTAQRLSQHKNIAGLKEASGDIRQVMETLRLCGEGFAVYSGCDEITLPVLACGGAGVISVAANVVPVQMRRLCAAYFAGEPARALAAQMALLPLIDALFARVNPIPVKAALALLGRCENVLRLPLVPMARDETAELQKQIKKALGEGATDSPIL